jgi:hypothetical protein
VLFPWGQSSWGMKLTTHLHPMPMLMCGTIPPLPHRTTLLVLLQEYKCTCDSSTCQVKAVPHQCPSIQKLSSVGHNTLTLLLNHTVSADSYTAVPKSPAKEWKAKYYSVMLLALGFLHVSNRNVTTCMCRQICFMYYLQFHCDMLIKP